MSLSPAQITALVTSLIAALSAAGNVYQGNAAPDCSVVIDAMLQNSQQWSLAFERAQRD